MSPRFEPAVDPMDFGAIPFPDDLYLDEGGRISLGRLPSEDLALPEYADSLRQTLGDLDGFSPSASIFFYFPSHSIDPTSLPESAAASMLDESSVFLVDADPGSPTAFRRVPVRVHWNADLGQIALRPYEGHPLFSGRRYAAVVTTRVRDDRGEPIGPGAHFLSIRNATTRPEDPVDAEAYEEYRPVLSSLATNGIPAENVAALAVFTVQTIARDLTDAREMIWADAPPSVVLDDAVSAGDPLDAFLGIPSVDAPGLDVSGGVAHSSIGWLIQGHFESPWFMSDVVDVHGRFERDGAGALRSTQVDEVPFTLTLPVGITENVPVVVFQHGLGQERSSMLAVADTLAASGYAVLAIDSPFHGMRVNAMVDLRHNYGGGDGPDGFGEQTGQQIYLDYLGIVEIDGTLPPFHPAYPRDALRQSVVDLMSAVRLLRQGDWAAVHSLPGLDTLSFDEGPLGFVGVSLGGIIGTMFAATEPEVGAALLNVTGGDLMRLVERSPSFDRLFLSILLPKLGVDPAAGPEYLPTFHPEVAIFQTLLDRGDSISYAPLLREREIDLLFQMAAEDETVPNSGTEALARATGAPIVDADPLHTDLPRVDAPVQQNVELMSSRRTRGLYVFAPATHGLLVRRRGERDYASPVEPPFAEMDPVAVDNPVDAALGQAVHFFESWRSGATELIAPAP